MAQHPSAISDILIRGRPWHLVHATLLRHARRAGQARTARGQHARKGHWYGREEEVVVERLQEQKDWPRRLCFAPGARHYQKEGERTCRGCHQLCNIYPRPCSCRWHQQTTAPRTQAAGWPKDTGARVYRRKAETDSRPQHC